MFFFFFVFLTKTTLVFCEFLVNRKRAYVSLDRLESLHHLFLALGILSNDPKSDAYNKVRSNFCKRLADESKNSRTMLRIHLDDFSDEEDCLKRSEGRLSLKFEEGLHQWGKHHWYSLGECLRDLVN